MKMENIILTVVADDKPGIVHSLSDIVVSHGGNWLDSSLSRLGGQFAGVVSVLIAPVAVEDLRKALAAMVESQIHVSIHKPQATAQKMTVATVELELEANDRPGIVEEVSTVLANHKFNVEKMTTYCESASMAGYDLFKAQIKVGLREGVSIADMEQALESISADVMVEIVY